MTKKIESTLSKMRTSPNTVRFTELATVCKYYFGKPRQNNGSHRIYKTPWPGNPRLNIQDHKGKAKVYQVKQAIAAIEKLEDFKNV